MPQQKQKPHAKAAAAATTKEIEIKIPDNLESVSLKFPYSLWKDARFQQRMMAVKSTGETYLEVTCDMDGMISLK